jgi:hypothetical protein
MQSSPRTRLLIGIIPLMIVAASGAAHAKWFRSEDLTDSCSTDVVIKIPFDSSNSLDSGDVILARNKAMKDLIQSNAYKGVWTNGPNSTSPWTDWIKPIPTNPDRFFRWFCGRTAERSRCPKNAGRIRARIGPSGLLETECWSWDPTQ